MAVRFKYRVGSVIRYITIAGRTRTIVVTSKSRNIKNNRPGFDGRETGGDRNMVWGYTRDILEVVRY